MSIVGVESWRQHAEQLAACTPPHRFTAEAPHAGSGAASRKWVAALYVNNLFDKRYVTGIGNTSASVLGTPYASVNRPRQVGVELRVNM
jgi:hypothetical protein